MERNVKVCHIVMIYRTYNNKFISNVSSLLKTLTYIGISSVRVHQFGGEKRGNN